MLKCSCGQSERGFYGDGSLSACQPTWLQSAPPFETGKLTFPELQQLLRWSCQVTRARTKQKGRSPFLPLALEVSLPSFGFTEAERGHCCFSSSTDWPIRHWGWGPQKDTETEVFRLAPLSHILLGCCQSPSLKSAPTSVK